MLKSRSMWFFEDLKRIFWELEFRNANVWIANFGRQTSEFETQTIRSREEIACYEIHSVNYNLWCLVRQWPLYTVESRRCTSSVSLWSRLFGAFNSEESRCSLRISTEIVCFDAFTSNWLALNVFGLVPSLCVLSNVFDFDVFDLCDFECRRNRKSLGWGECTCSELLAKAFGRLRV